MEIQQIINHIVDNVKNTQRAFAEKGLDYNPEIIARATYKELRQSDPELDELTFFRAIEKMHDDGLVITKANGLIFFSEAVLGGQMAEA